MKEFFMKTYFSRRQVLSYGAAAIATTGFNAQAQSPTKIIFGFTAVSDFASIFVGCEEGFFKKRGLDVEPKFIPLNPSIPAAIQSESLHIGGPTASVYLQAIDGGLDHVVVAGGGMTDKSLTGVGLVARAGSGIRTVQDCIGKKIGVPGFGAYLHVTFRAWLKINKVDPAKVNFVETSFPQHADLIRGGSIDAVVTADPFMGRILSSGAGYVASYYTTFLPDGMPTILYTARRDWAAKNAAAVKAFQESVIEAANFIKKPANNAKVREHIGKYIKLPPEILNTMQISPPGPVIVEKQLTYWVDMMNDQKMLKASPTVAKLLFK
jgi:NitT/TauT family transport system substrate-binding protein